jgi:hypothetical protein
MSYVNNTSLGTPVFDYSSRDYASIYSDLVARIPVYLPEWTSTSPNDFGIVLLQMYAYVGDILNYYIDRLAGEAFIQTATQPTSIINIAAMLDYRPTLANGSTVILSITASPSASVSIPPGTQFITQATANEPAFVFQTVPDSEQPSYITTPIVIPAGTTLYGVVAVQGTTYTSLPNANWPEFEVPASATPVPTLAVSNGTINQAYSLFYSPVSANSFFVYVDLGTGPEQWEYAPSLINYGPYDHVFSNFVDANNVMWIQFGDGINGYVPPLGSPIYCTYQVTAGTNGNVGANTINQPLEGLFGVVGVNNPAAATSGTNPESLASIQTNAPASLRTLNRAVTVNDFSTLAIQVPGVQWASAVQATYQIVNLYVCPFGGGNPSNLLQAQVLNYMESLSMANTTITIYEPVYVPVDITINLFVYPSYSNALVANAVNIALQNYLDLSNTGFGFRAPLGGVYQVILAQAGVNYAEVTTLNREFWAELNVPVVSGTTVTQLYVTELPEGVSEGDQIVVSDPTHATPNTQTFVASTNVEAGIQTIPVNNVTAVANFAVGSKVQDIGPLNGSLVQDVVMLPNEIPVVGTLTIIPSGGLS